MKDQTNEEPPDPMPGELPVTAGRPGTASARHVEKHGAVPVDPDALFQQVLDGANRERSGSDCTTATSPNQKERASWPPNESYWNRPVRSRMPGGVGGVAGAILPSRPDSPLVVRGRWSLLLLTGNDA